MAVDDHTISFTECEQISLSQLDDLLISFDSRQPIRLVIPRHNGPRNTLGLSGVRIVLSLSCLQPPTRWRRCCDDIQVFRFCLVFSFFFFWWHCCFGLVTCCRDAQSTADDTPFRIA